MLHDDRAKQLRYLLYAKYIILYYIVTLSELIFAIITSSLRLWMVRG